MFRGSSTHVARGLQETAASSSSIYSTYASMESGNTRRKQTLLSLIDVLTEMDRDKGLITPDPDTSSTPVSEEDPPTSEDDKLQTESAEQFFEFAQRIINLDRELGNLASAARHLGSSAGISSSTSKLRERLAKVLFLFRENAASLFPRKIERQPQEARLKPKLREQRRRSSRPTRMSTSFEDSLEAFPEQLKLFAEDVATFLNQLIDFSDSKDDELNQSMRGFESDLKYWSSCLSEYKNQFLNPPVQRYINDLSTEIGDQLESIADMLNLFIENRIPTIKFQQQRSSSNLSNLSTVSTVFSAVTATTLQFSYGTAGKAVTDTVNAFWFSSLVFSIAATVSALLGQTWKQAMYRSPKHRVPLWVLLGFERSPLIFLVMAVICFLTGFVLFAYSSNQVRPLILPFVISAICLFQGPVTTIIIAVLTAVTSLGLGIISAWFALERWIYYKHGGQKWLNDVISETITSLADLPAIQATRDALRWGRERLGLLSGCLKRISIHMPNAWKTRQRLPVAIPQAKRSDAPFSRPVDIPPEVRSSGPSEFQGDKGRISKNIDPRQHFVNAVRTVILMKSAARSMNQRRDSALGTRFTGESGTSPGLFSDPWVAALRKARETALFEKLKALEPIQGLSAHQALVRQVQFSPNGKYMATSSRDRTAVIFHVGAGILSVEGTNLVKLDLHGNVLDTYSLAHIQLNDAAITPDCTRLVGVGFAIPPKDGPQPRRHTRVEKRIVIYNMLTERVER
ncbi:hypothetical protein HYDPIDRAFT_190627 [Hydnomerulius pinastri MD-312]|uniref:Uncharacterized protein n=1 Tax=Hydnomerulius pinastri MD-312 TaxID=994086 RepID=A0A0C9V1E3_9AGAM|nr:hypothetical protein HYDPIDRAFT_190627 [Hydnomerulius pinastri MD-312]